MIAKASVLKTLLFTQVANLGFALLSCSFGESSMNEQKESDIVDEFNTL